MDLRCPKCGEPWENDSLHDRAKEMGSTYRRVAADFRKLGCDALGSRHSETKANPAIAMIYELSGDDMDGAASDIEDFGLGYDE